MIIRSLRQHWPSRKIEWLMSGMLTTWGFYLLLHPEVFTNPETGVLFAGMVSLSNYIAPYPALVWGGLAFAAGSARAIALFINGAYTRTPMIRVITSFISMFILTQIVIGLWKSGVPNMGLVVYPWLVVADLLSAHRAAIDVIHAAEQRRELKETNRAASDRLRVAA